MLSNSFTKISKLITRNIVVTQEFIDYADREADKSGYIDRKHCDYLLLEWFLRYGCNRPLVKHPLNYKHDWIWPPDFVDAKRMATKNFNITKDKSERGKTADEKLAMVKSRVSQGFLTHFLFYNTIDDGKIFKVGDIISHKFVSYERADHVLNNMMKSQYDGYYYIP